jgi:hypothetical protein
MLTSLFNHRLCWFTASLQGPDAVTATFNNREQRIVLIVDVSVPHFLCWLQILQVKDNSMVYQPAQHLTQKKLQKS